MFFLLKFLGRKHGELPKEEGRNAVVYSQTRMTVLATQNTSQKKIVSIKEEGRGRNKRGENEHCF